MEVCTKVVYIYSTQRNKENDVWVKLLGIGEGEMHMNSWTKGMKLLNLRCNV